MRGEELRSGDRDSSGPLAGFRVRVAGRDYERIYRVAPSVRWRGGKGSDGSLMPRPRRVLRIPLKVGDQVVGVIAIFALKEGKREFSATDQELFSILTRHAGIALDRAR